MIKTVSIDKSVIENEKWTPKFAYIFKKLEYSANAIKLERFISKGPSNGIDLRDFSDSGYNYVRILDMNRYFISYMDVKKVGLFAIPDKIILQEGDILFSRKGTPGLSTIVTRDDLNNVIGTEVILLRIREEYDPYYLVAFLNSKVFYEQIINNLSGALSSGINHPSLKNLKILYEDRLVNPISTKVQDAIDLHTKSSELLQRAQDLFYQRIDIDFSKIDRSQFYSVNLSNFSESNLWTPAYSFPLYVNTLREIKSKWNTVPLGKIATVKRGDEVGSINYNRYLEKKDTDVPFIRTSDLVNYELDPFPDYYIPEEIYNELGQDIMEGDVLFTKDGKIGMSAMVTKNDHAIIASGLVRIRLNEKANEYNLTPEYLLLVLSLKETGTLPAKRRTVIASTIPHLREERLKEIEIPLLDSSSIEKITDLIKKAFELKDKKKKLILEVSNKIDAEFNI